MNNLINRRNLLITGTASVALVTAAPSFALSKGSAEQLVQTVVTDALKAVNSRQKESAMFAQFEALFARYADVPLIARKSLGTAYKSASSAQKTAYVNAFKGYMARSYGSKYFKQFIGADIQLKKTKKVAGGYLVDTTVKIKNRSPFLTQWHVIDSKGSDKMYNIYVEGVSVLTDTRTQIGAMLDKRGGNMDKLIAHLKTAR